MSVKDAPFFVFAVEVVSENVRLFIQFDTFVQEKACGVGEGVEAGLGGQHRPAFDESAIVQQMAVRGYSVVQKAGEFFGGGEFFYEEGVAFVVVEFSVRRERRASA